MLQKLIAIPIYALLIASIYCAHNCHVERFLKLKLLKNYLGSTKTQQRLND
jgi:hypothetical protein